MVGPGITKKKRLLLYHTLWTPNKRFIFVVRMKTEELDRRESEREEESLTAERRSLGFSPDAVEWRVELATGAGAS